MQMKMLIGQRSLEAVSPSLGALSRGGLQSLSPVVQSALRISHLLCC